MEEKINLLVVDDEQIILDSIKKVLRGEDYLNIFTALNVEEALAVINKTRIDIILTDLMLPDIDGLEFIKIIKDMKPNIIIVMITGYATINTAIQAMQLGAFDYLAKPFTRDEMKKLIMRASSLVGMSEVSDLNGKAVFIEQESVKGKILKAIGEHSWMMLQEDGNVILGVERPLLINFGKIQTVYLPSKGDEIRQGSIFFQIFSTELRTQTLLSPLSGTIVDVNEKVNTEPNRALLDPYGEGWLIRIKPTNFNEEVNLMGR